MQIRLDFPRDANNSVWTPPPPPPPHRLRALRLTLSQVQCRHAWNYVNQWWVWCLANSAPGVNTYVLGSVWQLLLDSLHHLPEGRPLDRVGVPAGPHDLIPGEQSHMYCCHVETRIHSRPLKLFCEGTEFTCAHFHLWRVSADDWCAMTGLPFYSEVVGKKFKKWSHLFVLREWCQFEQLTGLRCVLNHYWRFYFIDLCDAGQSLCFEFCWFVKYHVYWRWGVDKATMPYNELEYVRISFRWLTLEKLRHPFEVRCFFRVRHPVIN